MTYFRKFAEKTGLANEIYNNAPQQPQQQAQMQPDYSDVDNINISLKGAVGFLDEAYQQSANFSGGQFSQEIAMFKDAVEEISKKITASFA